MRQVKFEAKMRHFSCTSSGTCRPAKRGNVVIGIVWKCLKIMGAIQPGQAGFFMPMPPYNCPEKNLISDTL